MKIRVVHDPRAYAALLTSPEVQADLQRRAERIAAAAGDGFVAEQSRPVRRRARSAVIAVTYEARRRNSKDNVLLKSLDAGR